MLCTVLIHDCYYTVCHREWRVIINVAFYIYEKDPITQYNFEPEGFFYRQ